MACTSNSLTESQLSAPMLKPTGTAAAKHASGNRCIEMPIRLKNSRRKNSAGFCRHAAAARADFSHVLVPIWQWKQLNGIPYLFETLAAKNQCR